MHLKRISSEARIKNSTIITRLDQIKQRRQAEEEQTVERFKKQQAEALKKLRYNYEDALYEYEVQKEAQK